MDVNSEKTFLHDIATPLSVCRHAINMMMEEAAAEAPSPFQEKLKKRMTKIDQSVAKMEELLTKRRSDVNDLKAGP